MPCLVTVLMLAVSAPAPAAPRLHPKGLQALGAPGTLAGDSAALAFELELLGAINRARAKAGVSPLSMDERLRAFARREAELAARDGADPSAASRRVAEQGLGPHGHRLRYAFGTTARRVVAEMQRDPATKAAMLSELVRVGLGAFWVPVEAPAFQVMLLLVTEPDPMAGKPGLSPEQTDPVMRAAEPRIRACYDRALTSSPNLRGDVVLQLVIGASGKVGAAKLLRSLGAADFDACALAVARRLAFPAPYKGRPVTLNQPMRFSPPRGGERDP